MVVEHSYEIFGNDTVYFDLKKISSKSGIQVNYIWG